LALVLGACTRSVMVERVDDTPPPRPRVTPATPADGGATYTVQPGDTLYKISVQYGIDYRDLAAWNGIAAPYTIYPRQRLRVQSGSALVASPPPPAAAPAAGAGRADVAASAQPPATPRPPPAPGYDPELGVTLPEGAQPITAGSPASSAAAAVFEDPQATPSAPAASAPAVSPAQATAPAASAATAPAAVATTTSAPAASPAPATSTSAQTAVAAPPASAGADIAPAHASPAGWIWPTHGKVVASYASGDPTRQGIDIAGEPGQSVRAARDGEVVYSGAGLIGYGELIIIKHSPELLSAYGHNRVRLVKEGNKVKSGQKIAEMGRNAANRVLLHFEVRKNGKPVDPLPLLPSR